MVMCVFNSYSILYTTETEVEAYIGATDLRWYCMVASLSASASYPKLGQF